MGARNFILTTCLLLGMNANASNFETDIRPLLAEHCLKCHGEKKRKGGLRLTNRRDALQPRDSGKAAIIPGDSTASLLIQKIISEDPEKRMPPKG